MPRLISSEEAKKLGLRPIGKKHPVRVAIETMEKGEHLHITRTEFPWKKRTPTFFVNQVSKGTGKRFHVSETRNKAGWVVERVE